jgi:hypothetical protein
MITLTHSEAFAYDLLSIAYVKLFHNPRDKRAHKNVMDLSAEIERQVGGAPHEAILASDSFDHLYRVNDEMYVRINEIKQRKVTAEDATYIDDRVYQRFLAKKALQEKWFPDDPLTEQKFGYQNAK